VRNMSVISPLEPDAAPGKSKTLLDAVKASLGMVPNLFGVMAHSPATLEGFLSFNSALGAGTLDAKLRERIALAVAEENSCGYCLSAHSLLGKGAGLDDSEIGAARDGRSADSRSAEALRFALKVVRSRGRADPTDIKRLRDAGFSDGQVVEIIANVVANIFTNYVNHVAATSIDFPVVEPKRRIA